MEIPIKMDDLGGFPIIFWKHPNPRYEKSWVQVNLDPFQKHKGVIKIPPSPVWVDPGILHVTHVSQDVGVRCFTQRIGHQVGKKSLTALVQGFP